MKHINWSVIGVVVLVCLAFICGVETEYLLKDKIRTVIIFESTDINLKPVKNEFENTVVLSVFHLYDTYTELYAEYIELMNPATDDLVWGWSNCEWQPEHNYSACDIYVVRPKFVNGVSMDTIGHEVWHGVAGSFHE